MAYGLFHGRVMVPFQTRFDRVIVVVWWAYGWGIVGRPNEALITSINGNIMLSILDALGLCELQNLHGPLVHAVPG